MFGGAADPAGHDPGAAAAAPPDESRTPRRTVAVAVAALAWWLLVWVALEPSVLTRVPILDELYYLRAGEAVAAGQLLPSGPFFMSPLYPYLIAATGSGHAPGPDGVLAAPPTGLRLAQALAWAAIAWLLYRAARDLLIRRGLQPRAAARWAYLPPALFVAYRPAAVFVSSALLEIPLTAAVTAYLALLGAATDDGPIPRRGGAAVARSLGAGLLVGAAALLRAHAVLLLLPGWFEARRWGRRRPLLLLAGAALLLLPVIAFNSARVGRPAGISLNGGLNLYIGQHPAATGLFTTFSGFDAEEDPAGVVYLSDRLGRTVAGPGEADRIWLREAWRSVAAEPLRAARLWLRKVWLHFQRWEIAQITPLAAWPREAWPLRLLIVPFGVISALALWGLGLHRGRERGLRPWLAGLALLVAGQSLFFVVTRYRLTIVPILCLLAGLGLVEGLAAVAPGWRQRLGFEAAAPVGAGRRRLIALAALGIALLVVQPWGLSEAQRVWTALAAENEAVRWSRWGLREEAAPAERSAALARADSLYRHSLAELPNRWLGYRGLARSQAAAGRADAAVASLEDGIVRARDPQPLQRELILLLLRLGRLEEALAEIPAYLRDRPEDAEIRHNYVVLLGKSGRFEAALVAARDLVATSPGDPRGYVDLGVLLARGGDSTQARAVFAAGLRRFPGHPDLTANLAALDGTTDPPQ